MARPREDVRERFYKYVQKSSGCWEWIGTINNGGYGRFTIILPDRKLQALAHRISYELHVRPLLAGECIDHLCRNRKCVNPSHLEPVSTRENLLRSPITLAGINAAKKTCAMGHAYRYTKTGSRICSVCHGERRRERERQKCAQ